MWQPASERLQHFQTMLKTKLNVLTLRKEPLPTVIFREPEAIELCSATPHAKSRTHSGYKVTYLGKMTISGTQFLSGCTESAVVSLVERRASSQQQGTLALGKSMLEIRPFQVRLHHLDECSEGSITVDTYQVARIAYCTADHSVRPNVFAWIYREINDDLSFQMDCHAVECESKLEAKKLAHSMMEAFRKTFQSMSSEGRIHKSGSTDDFAEDSSTPDDSTPDDG
ncbi:PTB-containing, cubilin and LRP1-interacting protein [Cyprinodon tularosa]|uniref:PTB-containing, cubilin and LRP1-interacting protein n=1 Tax=Cyprinodon tularosa TaxID=77115 RepID=UPI0018E1DD70|nr:PTB-containing, cubilin and LRP1-interacting protein [Cyprinodon tularosa]